MSKETEKPTSHRKNNPLKEIWDRLKKGKAAETTGVEETPIFSILEKPVVNPYTPPTKADSAEHFESLLFQYGTLAYNPELVAKDHARNLSVTTDWLKKHRKDRGSRYIKREIEDFKRKLEYEKQWLIDYQGKVPMHWNFWSNIILDFETAQNLGLEINSFLIRAALDHGHWQVREAAFTFSPTNFRAISDN